MKKPSAPIRLVCVLLSIVLALSMMAGILIANIRIATTVENTARIIRQTLFTTQTVRHAPAAVSSGAPRVSRSPVRMAKVRLDEESSTGIITEILVDWLYENLTEQYDDSLTVTQADVEAFVEASTLKDDISNLGASLINDFITGNNNTTLDEATITSLIQENAALIESYFGVALSSDMISTIVSTITSSNYVAQLQSDGIGGLLLNTATGSNGSQDETIAPGDSGTAGGDDSSTLSDGSVSNDTAAENPVADLLNTFRKATSIGAMIACFGVAAACMAALILLNLKYIWYALKKIGVSLLISSLPSLIPTLFAKSMASLGVVGAVIGMILQITAPVCICVCAAGIVLIAASVIVKRNVKKQQSISAATEELSNALMEEEPAQEIPAEPEETEAE